MMIMTLKTSSKVTTVMMITWQHGQRFKSCEESQDADADSGHFIQYY